MAPAAIQPIANHRAGPPRHQDVDDAPQELPGEDDGRTGQVKTGKLAAHHETPEVEVRVGRQEVGQRSPRRGTETEHEAHREQGQQAAGERAFAPAGERQGDAYEDGDRYNRQGPFGIENLARKQPFELLAGSVALHVNRVGQGLVDGGPLTEKD